MKNRLEELRKQRGIRQEELAEILQVSRQTIGSLENGRYNPSILLAFKIALVFGMPPLKTYSSTKRSRPNPLAHLTQRRYPFMNNTKLWLKYGLVALAGGVIVFFGLRDFPDSPT